MTCKATCNTDKKTGRRIINIKLVSDTDGTLCQLILNNQNRSARLVPLQLAGPDKKLICLPGRLFEFH